MYGLIIISPIKKLLRLQYNYKYVSKMKKSTFRKKKLNNYNFEVKIICVSKMEQGL